MGRRPLTRRQHDVFSFIAGEISANGFAPTLEEIGGALGVRSPATVHNHLERLQAKGWVRRSNRSRDIEVLPDRDLGNDVIIAAMDLVVHSNGPSDHPDKWLSLCDAIGALVGADLALGDNTGRSAPVE